MSSSPNDLKSALEMSTPPLEKDGQGYFIVFEGIDGCGKTTQLEKAYQWLQEKLANLLSPPSLLKTREPGATELGKSLRSLLLQPHWETVPPDPRAELLMYAADRAQHVQQILKPHLRQGGWILCDRHVDSTVAYQGYGRGLDLRLIEQLNAIATDGLGSDLTLWIDVPVEVAQSRLQKRYQAQRSSGGDRMDRMETNDQAFHQRVYQGFATLSTQEPQRIVRVDGNQDPETIALEIQRILCDRLELGERG
jgi:dTMP kinase